MEHFPVAVLWILPIIGLGSFLFLIALQAEQKRGRGEQRGGRAPASGNNEGAEERQGEFEGSLGTLTSALHNQRTSVEHIQRENLAYTAEVNRLRLKLSELQEEYDLLSSENFTLRAQVKRLRTQLASHGAGDGASSNASAAVERKLYDDTRLLKTAEVAEQIEKQRRTSTGRNARRSA